MKKNRASILFVLCLHVCMSTLYAQKWAWQYKKNIQSVAGQAQTAFFSKEGVAPFTQLIFSWNARRPQHGYFSFFVAARNGATKKWGAWHHMMDWGAHGQKTYASPSDGIAHYVHVRLETDEGKSADAFRIKMCTHGAPLSLLSSCSVTLSHRDLFTSEADTRFSLPSVALAHIPCIGQFGVAHKDKERICSPTSATMLVSYLKKQQLDPALFADHVYDPGLDSYGSWPFTIAHMYDQGAGLFGCSVTRLDSFAQLHRQLMKGIPVIVSVRGALKGAPREYIHGHLLLVVGWDNEKKELLCHDSAHEFPADVPKRYELASFIQAWERSRRLVYWVEPKIKKL